MTSTETKVNVNELINISGYGIVKGTIPPFEELKDEFSNVWEDLYLNEDLAEHVGEPCFFITDDVNYNYRGCYLGDKCNKEMLVQIIDNLDNVIFDLIYPDILEQIENQTGDEEIVDKLSCSQNYEDLYDYVVKNNINISDYELSWLKILGLGRMDLLEEIKE